MFEFSDYTSGFTIMLSYLFDKTITFLCNYVAWIIISVQSCRLIVFVMVGSLSLTYLQEWAYKRFSILLEKSSRSHHANLADDEMSVFRSIHLLVETYNEAIQYILFVYLVTCTTCQIISVSTAILPKDTSPILPKFFFWNSNLYKHTQWVWFCRRTLQGV